MQIWYANHILRVPNRRLLNINNNSDMLITIDYFQPIWYLLVSKPGQASNSGN